MQTSSFNLLIITALLFFSTGCGTSSNRSTETAGVEYTTQPDSVFQAVVVVSGNGWGYRITQNKSVIINQPTIPAINGNQAFKSEAEARSVAMLVVEKLNRGHMPPSVTVKELDSLGITY